jgi:hypothetical protein
MPGLHLFLFRCGTCRLDSRTNGAVLSFDTGLAPFQQLYILNPAAAGYFPAAFSLQSPALPLLRLVVNKEKQPPDGRETGSSYDRPYPKHLQPPNDSTKDDPRVFNEPKKRPQNEGTCRGRWGLCRLGVATRHDNPPGLKMFLLSIERHAYSFVLAPYDMAAPMRAIGRESQRELVGDGGLADYLEHGSCVR